MRDLATLQSDFVEAILGFDGGNACPNIIGDSASADLRLAIYRNTVLSGLCDALRLSYPVTERLVGTEFFDQTVLAFTRKAPPGEPVLARYGADFPEFLQSLTSLAGLPYLADVARLEWAVDQAGYSSAAHRQPGCQFTLATESGSATVTLAGSLRLLKSATAIHAIWKSVRSRDDDALAGLDWTDGPQWLAIHRTDDDVAVTPLTLPAWNLCAALLAGEGIESATAGSRDLAMPIDEAVLALEVLTAPFVQIKLRDPKRSKRPS